MNNTVYEGNLLSLSFGVKYPQPLVGVTAVVDGDESRAVECSFAEKSIEALLTGGAPGEYTLKFHCSFADGTEKHFPVPFEVLAKEDTALLTAEATEEKVVEIEELFDDTPRVFEKRRFTREEAKRVGDSIGIDWAKVNIEQFRQGLSVEMEHTDDPETQVASPRDLRTVGKIAWRHLKELGDYYTKLAEMEGEGNLKKFLVQRGDKWCVTRNNDGKPGKTIKCYSGPKARERALALLRAIEVNKGSTMYLANDIALSVKAIIRNASGQVLLLKDAYSDWIDLPGGHVQENEELETALQREVWEETHLRIESCEEFMTLILPSRSDGPKPVIFFNATASGEVVLSEEHTAFFWVDEFEMEKFNLGRFREVLLSALTKPFNVSSQFRPSGSAEELRQDLQILGKQYARLCSGETVAARKNHEQRITLRGESGKRTIVKIATRYAEELLAREVLTFTPPYHGQTQEYFERLGRRLVVRGFELPEGKAFDALSDEGSGEQSSPFVKTRIEFLPRKISMKRS